MEQVTRNVTGSKQELAMLIACAQQNEVELFGIVQKDIFEYEAAIKLIKGLKTWKFSLNSFVETLLGNEKIQEAVDVVFTNKQEELSKNRNSAVVKHLVDIIKYLEISYAENLEYSDEVEKSIGGAL